MDEYLCVAKYVAAHVNIFACCILIGVGTISQTALFVELVYFAAG